MYLTGQTIMTDVKNDRPAVEIVITPDMVKAGLEELLAFDLRFEDHEDAVLRILKAALLKQRSK